MTPKEKANELGNKFYQGSVFDYDKEGHIKECDRAKNRAKLCVKEIVQALSDYGQESSNELQKFCFLNSTFRFWDAVDIEIEKL